VGCPFCATGLNGLKRNLTSGEIYDQYLLTQKYLAEETKISNIVFMGMGEPFLNYDNVMKAAAALTDQLGAGLAAKRITISTVGLIAGIMKLADDNPRLGLAISLHSAIENKRQQLIPIAKNNPLDKLKEAAIYYAHKADDRVTFEYLLINDINDSIEDAKALVEFIKGIPCKINLITYNEVQGINFSRPPDYKVEAFQDYLYPRAPVVTIRKSKGADIAAACGQLAGNIQSADKSED
jgi:23S rRNA (adenine2503-C2)-methyltransferase